MAGNVARPGLRQISSPTNSLLKVFRRALVEGVTRDGWLAVEGPRLVEEAIMAAGDPKAGGPDDGVKVHSVLLSQGSVAKLHPLLKRLPRETEVAEVPDRLFQAIAATQTPQGIAALVELRAYDLDSLLAGPSVVLLVACGLQDPGNLGTMVRSAYALGAGALVTLKATVSPFNPKAVRSSAGAVFRLPLFSNLGADTLIRRLRAASVRIVAADRRSSSTIAQTDLGGPVAFLIGKEAAGLDERIFREADLLLSIPIRPETDSVNAAIAAGIFLYEAGRQRGFHY